MRGSNLHAFWDSGMIRYYKEQDANWTDTVLKQANRPAKPWQVKDAAQESCQIVMEERFYPPRSVGSDYAEQYRAMIMQRLSLAGQRLATLLNGVWQ